MFKSSLVVSLLAVSALATFPFVNEIGFDHDTVVNANWENVLKTGDVLAFSRIFRDLEHRQTCVDPGYGLCPGTNSCCPSSGVCCIINGDQTVGQSSRHLITAPAFIEPSYCRLLRCWASHDCLVSGSVHKNSIVNIGLSAAIFSVYMCASQVVVSRHCSFWRASVNIESS
jgi:hypothetical protein